jgi:hypothetical protein
MSKNFANKIFQKSRMDEYCKILDFAIEREYILTSLSDWYENEFYPGRKVLILRHDVDYFPQGAYRMFLIEKERKIKSTFYFRWSTADKAIIKKISQAGFEVSLHFETLATYCKQKRIYTADKVTKDVYLKCRALLINEVREFEIEFGKINTLCSHGDRWNIKVGIPNHCIMNENFCSDLDIYFETYDQNILAKFNTYISDSSAKYGHKWKYGLSPVDAMDKGVESICLLTHPHHWDYHFRQNVKMLLIELKQKLEI